MKNIYTIKGHITILLGTFFLLVLLSVGVMSLNIRTQEHDAQIINLAGRQRMLSQKITYLSVSNPENSELYSSLQTFEQNWHALRNGGLATDASGKQVLLPPAPDEEMIALLDDVKESWDVYRSYLISNNHENLSSQAAILLYRLDLVVESFQARSDVKNHRLQVLQGMFLVVASSLLAWGFVFMRKQIVSPLTVLSGAVDQITKGNLEMSIPPLGKDELGELAIAIDGMREELALSRDVLESRVDQRTKELVSAFEFSQEIVAQRELEVLINSVVERARNLMGAHSVALCFLGPNGKTLEMVANKGETSVSLGAKNTINPDLHLTVINSGETVSQKTGCIGCEFLDEIVDGESVIVPLRIKDQMIGALCVRRSEESLGEDVLPFDQDGQKALALLANSAAVAIANARLAQLEHQKIEQDAALAERELIAADLHDDLAQILGYTRLKLDDLKEFLSETPFSEEETNLAQITSAVNKAYTEVRSMLAGIVKEYPTSEDLIQQVSNLVEEFDRESNITAKLNVDKPLTLALSESVQAQMLHVIREALLNVQKHSRATNVSIDVVVNEGLATVHIIDDGIGFDPSIPLDDSHFGLKIMQARVKRSGGTFKIDSGPTTGTVVTLQFPIDKMKTGTIFNGYIQ